MKDSNSTKVQFFEKYEDPDSEIQHGVCAKNDKKMRQTKDKDEHADNSSIPKFEENSRKPPKNRPLLCSQTLDSPPISLKLNGVKLKTFFTI